MISEVRMNSPIVNEEKSRTKIVKLRRIKSIDLARGLVVIFSVFVSNIPTGGYVWLRHAEWFGLTITDLIFPGFLTLFGMGMSIAYSHKVKWKKVIKRTIVFLFLGLGFNMIVAWKLDFTTLRFTGVLQVFSITGILAVLATRIYKAWWNGMVIASILLIGSTMFMLGTSSLCPDGLPQPTCNKSVEIDKSIFGEKHLYWQGQRGFDPEGIISILGSLANVLFGYSAGSVLIKRKKDTWLKLLGISVILVISAYLMYQMLPFNKRLWTGSFSCISAAVMIIFVAFLYRIIDSPQPNKNRKISLLGWGIEAFGRNSLLIYFGKFILSSLMVHITLNFADNGSVHNQLLNWIESWSGYPQITFALIITFFWIIIALTLHRKKWYVTI